MNKIPSPPTYEYDNASGTNPSLLTAGLPTGSIMTTRLIHPSSTSKQNHHLNQNRATDTQPISIPNSQQDKDSQYTILSHRTISDTYLNLTRKDINDVMTALHTLADYVQNDIDNSHLKMLYSKSTNSSSQHYCHHPRYSLSSDRWLNHHHHHHIKHHRNLINEFPDDFHDIKRKQQQHRMLRQLQYHEKYFNHHNPSNYPSYSSNAILYTSTRKSNSRPRQIHHCSQQHQSTIKIPSEDQYQQSIKKKLSSSISLSSYILDKLVYINQKEPISNIQILPQQAHTIQILQNNPTHNFMSIDSLNNQDIFLTPLIPYHLSKPTNNQISGMGDQLNLNKIDVATQWSLQMLTPKCIHTNESKSDLSLKHPQNSKVHVTHTNSTILTELSRSTTTTTIATNNISVINDQKSSSIVNDEHGLTKSETERFLTTLNIPTCKCLTTKLQTVNTSVQQSSGDDNITCISLDNDSSIGSSLSLNKKKIKQTSIKLATKRPRHHTSKSSKTNPTTKRSRPQSTNRSIIITQSYKTTTDRKEDSSFDFFDVDTTFSDGYDRLFTDTTTSEKSS